MILSGIVSIDYRCVHAKSEGRRSKGQGHRGRNIANLSLISAFVFGYPVTISSQYFQIFLVLNTTMSMQNIKVIGQKFMVTFRENVYSYYTHFFIRNLRSGFLRVYIVCTMLQYGSNCVYMYFRRRIDK